MEKIQGRRHHTLIKTGLLNDVHEKKIIPEWLLSSNANVGNIMWLIRLFSYSFNSVATIGVQKKIIGNGSLAV